jgi:polyhydroxyalkanoate synthesis regulator phasin
MTVERGLLDKIRSRGEEVLTQLSGELMSNPRFMKAIEGAMRGREKLEEAAASALKQMNVPTRSELKRASARIETLEREVAELRQQVRSRRAGTAAKGPARKPAARPGATRAGARPGRAGVRAKGETAAE